MKNNVEERHGISVAFIFDAHHVITFNKFKQDLYTYAIARNLPFPRESDMMDYILDYIDRAQNFTLEMLLYPSPVNRAKVLRQWFYGENIRKFNRRYFAGRALAERYNFPDDKPCFSSMVHYTLEKIMPVDPAHYYRFIKKR